MEYKFRAWDNFLSCYSKNSKEIAYHANGKFSIVTGDRYIIEMFTGLRDSKRTEEYPEGQEIFEGDVVKVVALSNDHHQKGATMTLYVKYFMGNACLCEKGHETGVPIYPFCVNHTLEIIGSIYDNPELLEGRE